MADEPGELRKLLSIHYDQPERGRNGEGSSDGKVNNAFNSEKGKKKSDAGHVGK